MYEDDVISILERDLEQKLTQPPPAPAPTNPRQRIPDTDGLPTPHRAAKHPIGFTVTENQEPIGGDQDQAARKNGYKIGATMRSIVMVDNHNTKVSSTIAANVLGAAAAHALSKYIDCHNRVEAKSSSQQYGMPSAGGGHRVGGQLPASEVDWRAGNWLDYVHKALPAEHKHNLRRIMDLFHAEKRDETIATLGFDLTGMQSVDAHEGGITGYFKSVGELLYNIDRNYQSLLAKKYLDAGEKIKYRSCNAIRAF